MEHKPNRLYKSRLFVMIFEDRRNLLELYNAVSGKTTLFWRRIERRRKM